MISHVTSEDARRWLTSLDPDDAAFVRTSLERGQTQRGRLLLVAFDLSIDKAAYHRVMGETEATRDALREALDRFSELASAADAEPKWLRIGLSAAVPIAFVLEDERRIAEALECAERLMQVDEDIECFFAAAQIKLHRSDRVSAAKYLHLALREKGNGGQWEGLLEALDGAISSDEQRFSQGMMKALTVYNSDIECGGGKGSTSAVFFFPVAGLLAVSRHVNPDFSYDRITDLRLLPDFA